MTLKLRALSTERTAEEIPGKNRDEIAPKHELLAATRGVAKIAALTAVELREFTDESTRADDERTISNEGDLTYKKLMDLPCMQALVNSRTPALSYTEIRWEIPSLPGLEKYAGNEIAIDLSTSGVIGIRIVNKTDSKRAIGSYFGFYFKYDGRDGIRKIGTQEINYASWRELLASYRETQTERDAVA